MFSLGKWKKFHAQSKFCRDEHEKANYSAGEETEADHSLFQQRIGFTFVIKATSAAGTQLLFCFLHARCFSWAGDRQVWHTKCLIQS